MPIAHLYITEGRSEEQKKQLIEKVTNAFVDVLAISPDVVSIVLQDVPKAHWGVGGKSVAERAKQTAS